jgi:hypothetical protein
MPNKKEYIGSTFTTEKDFLACINKCGMNKPVYTLPNKPNTDEDELLEDYLEKEKLDD